MLSVVHSAALHGIDGFSVTVEVNAEMGLDGFEIVGLPDAAVKEAKERVVTAATNLGLELPEMALTVNLAPADRRKEGTGYDLAMIIGILSCIGSIKKGVSLDTACFASELSLSGDLRSIRGILCLCAAAREAGFSEFYCARENAPEAAAVEGMLVYPVDNVRQLVRHLNGEERIAPMPHTDEDFEQAPDSIGLDFSDVKGQLAAKRAMEVAAAGGHNILLIGPPGTGKSMLAKRLPTILPPLTFAEAIETTKIHSVAGVLPDGVALMRTRPFRSPHHTMSPVSLVGGGIIPKPGEVSLADNGVLFLDELPEFPRQVSDSLRQPIEDRRVTITRASGRTTYPCSFMLVAAMNPCRCGYFGHPTHPCSCSQADVKNYIGRISGPMLDRMDIQIELPYISFEEMSDKNAGESSATIRARVIKARAIARERAERLGLSGVYCNAQLDSAGLRAVENMSPKAVALLKTAYEKLGLSARGYDRTVRLARTIADLAASETIEPPHIAEAIALRTLDRKYWR